MARTHWDLPSHFIGSADCRFGITDVVAGYIVSTVGDYRPKYDGGARMTIGSGRYYETMVFRDSGRRCTDPECGCELPLADDFHDIDFDGYMTEDEARAGHAAMVERWRNGNPKEAAS